MRRRGGCATLRAAGQRAAFYAASAPLMARISPYLPISPHISAPLMARLSVGEVGGRREPQQQGEPLPHPRVAAASRRASSPCCPAPPGGGRTRATCQCSSTCSTRCSSPTRAQACPRLAETRRDCPSFSELAQDLRPRPPPHSFVDRIKVRHARRLRAALRPQRARGNSALALRSSPLPPSS